MTKESEMRFVYGKIPKPGTFGSFQGKLLKIRPTRETNLTKRRSTDVPNELRKQKKT